MVGEDRNGSSNGHNEMHKKVLPCTSGVAQRDDVNNEGLRTQEEGAETERSWPKQTHHRTRILIETMKVKQLREELARLGLPIEGKKIVLQERLREAMDRDQEEEEEEEEEEGEDEDEDEDEEEEEEDRIGGNGRNIDTTKAITGRSTLQSANIRRMRERGSELERESVKSETNLKACGIATTSMFTIRDVEGSIPFFTGDDNTPIRKWLADFEDMAMLLNWNDLQRLIYGRKMLSGSAKQFIALEQGLTSWQAFKRSLIQEFQVKVNSATIHMQLQKRKKQANETSRQYVYAMQTIANQGYVEDEALIQYVIDGIQDDETNKQILYISRTINELKKNLEIYDQIKEKSGKKKVIGKEETKSKISRDRKFIKYEKAWDERKSYCFGCGAAEHAVRECPYKEKGPKCFKCGQFGHISSRCENQETNEVGCVNCVAVEDEIVTVRLNETTIPALLDTGSFNTLLRRDEYCKIGRPKLRTTTRVFKGFGNAKSRAIGVFSAQMTIDGEVYENDIYVVPDEVMNSKMLLGKDLLKQMNINLRGGKISIQKIRTQEAKEVVKNTDLKKEECKMKQPISKTDGKEEDEENSVEIVGSELGEICFVQQNEIDVQGKYQEEIKKIIDTYKPAKQTQTKIETRIILKDGEPVRSRACRLSVKEKDILQQQVDESLRDGVVQSSHSPYASAVVIVPKKDGTICPSNVKIKAVQRFGLEEKMAFTELKRILTTEPVLRLYRADAITELHTDASKFSYGAAWLQRDNETGDFHPVYFMSRKITFQEQALYSYELEALGIVNAVKKLRVYLHGIRFKMVTDYNAFQKTLEKQDIALKVARWALLLEDFNYTIEHCTGQRLRHVDVFSRHPIMIIKDPLRAMIQRKQSRVERLHPKKRVRKKKESIVVVLRRPKTCRNGRVWDANKTVLEEREKRCVETRWSQQRDLGDEDERR